MNILMQSLVGDYFLLVDIAILLSFWLPVFVSLHERCFLAVLIVACYVRGYRVLIPLVGCVFPLLSLSLVGLWPGSYV